MKSVLVKMGGRALQEALKDENFFSPLKDLKSPIMLVHGGGAEISQWAERFQVPSEFVQGQRVTSPELMEIVQSVLCGHLNPTLVWRLGRLGLSAVGVNGYADRLLECEIEKPELGLVGRVTQVRSDLLSDLQKKGRIPVIAPVGILKDGRRCNVNADLAACKIAAALGTDRAIFMTDTDGILDVQGKVLPHLTVLELETLESNGTIKGGMFVKSRAVKEFLDGNPKGEVFVANGMKKHVLQDLLSGKTAGTQIQVG